MDKPPGKVIETDADEVPALPLKKAKKGSKSGLGDTGASALSSNDGGTRGMMLTGSHPAAVVLNGMATIEQQIKAMSRYINLTAIAAPFLDEIKAAAASGLADLISGGTGAANVSMPGAGAGAAPPPPPAGMPMAPPPPPMQQMPMAA